MASFNKIVIVGYLGRDPETRHTPQGDAVTSFSVATSERRQSGEDTTTWFRVTCWRRQAEVAAEYLSKGKQVYVEGRLRQAEYTDKDGNKRTTLEVTCSDLQFLGAAGSDDRSGNRAAMAAQAPTPTKAAAKPQQARLPGTGSGMEVNDDDIPF